MPDWKDEVTRLDIADVALRLGVQLSPGRRTPRLAVCPFHDDASPSLHLYQDNDPHYHCFACHAHGDTVELVKRKRGVDFHEALKWLDDIYRLGLGDNARRRVGGADIHQRALAHLREQDDGRQISAFAESRGFSRDALSAAGLTSGALESFLQGLAHDGDARDQAIEAGLAYAPEGELSPGLRSSSLSPFVRGAALFIPLSNLRGKVAGIMARPFAGQGAKYRFTAKFRKSEVLYRADHVRRLIQAGGNAAFDGAEDRFDLFVVEGVFDALRLETLGFPAVALLGAALSDSQADQIGELAEFALEKGRVMRLHLFLDADDGGRRGVGDAVPRLLGRATERDFLIDVVAVDRPEAEKADPDVLLKTMSPEQAGEFLRDHLTSGLDALAAISLGLKFAEAPGAIEQLDAAGAIALQNRLARRLQKLDWPRIWRDLHPHRTTLGDAGESALLTQAYERLAHDLRRRMDTDAARALPATFEASERSADANLLHALVLARESADTREYPVDVAAWDRIDEGAPVFLPVLEARLREARGPNRPYLAHYEAKDSGAPRLKCGPCPEDAIQQQYVLSELLRVRPENRDVAEQLPAVRYWADQPNLVVTGETRPRNAVSFAYQIDMRALEERPDRTRRRDMFRPFLDCWNSFIRHIGGRIERMQCDLIYVARLDIKSFYDNIPRHAVARALDRALPSDDTLKLLDIAGRLGGPDEDRKATLIRWLLDHSFGADGRGYAYADPATGIPAWRQGGGAKGLPQGPALSSYLANIVLFDLDAALEARVHELDAAAAQDEGTSRTCGGVYARYVDDIIISARSPDALRALRGAIESKLQTLGLELNEKSQHLAPMTAEEARNWVVERRGAGFVAYGDVDDQPAPASDLRTGWGDIPSLDRRTALSVLHWSALDNPEQIPREDFEGLISKVAEAEALRAPDLGHVARRVLLRSALDALEPGGDDLDAATRERFIGHLKSLLKPLRPTVDLPRVRTDERPVALALAAAREYAAVLAGIERLITSSPENNPTFSDAVRRDIGRAKQALLRWILNDKLLAELAETLVPPEQRHLVQDQLGAQLEIQNASLEERAVRALRLNGAAPHETVKPRDRGLSPSKQGAAMVRIGWLRTFCPDALESIRVDDSKDLDLTLHLIAAGAQVEGQRLAAPLETLTSETFSAAVAYVAETQLSSLATMPLDAASRIAATFRALAGVSSADMVEFADALPALLAWAAGPGRAAALARRPHLLQKPLPGVIFLPVPPLPNQPGLFGFEPVTNRVHALFTLASDAPLSELPHDLEWREADAVGGLQHFTADLPSQQVFLLDPVRQQRRIDDDLATIADVFEGLVQRHGLRRSAMAPLVNVFSLIGPTRRGKDTALAGYFSLSWSVPREQADRLIFERRGEGLALQRSPHAGAELWRIGQAVSDLYAIPQDSEDEEDAAGVETDRRLLQARLGVDPSD